jgi:hypothetical protein
MKKSILLILCLISVIPMLDAQHLELGKDLTTTQAIHENLYVMGENIAINAPVYGDLVTAGGRITINDTIQKDILLAGGTVFSNGYAGNDVLRCVGSCGVFDNFWCYFDDYQLA